ncbi:MAG: hypothetical protein IIB60_06190, partial [Planctomycetes bacterium]|nr:hypothetical protein [Planctomycetota bacterium]
MAQTVNRIKNPDFSGGKTVPRSWTWTSETGSTKWQRGEDADQDRAGGISITSPRATAGAWWSQVVACKPGQFYRVEATVTCDVDALDEAGGCLLSIQPMANGRPTGERCVTPAVHRSSGPIDIRAYYEAPADVRRVMVSVGLAQAQGVLRIHHVRFIAILEPDADSHILAIPVPASACPPPRSVRNVCVCSERADDRPMTSALRRYFGEAQVRALLPEKLSVSGPRADALLLPDPTPPRGIRSLLALMKLAGKRIVVISLPAFASLTRGALKVRRIEQDDDPIHAKVAWANYATRGFALVDVFPYAWTGETAGSFVQNQFRSTPAVRAFCKKHGLETLLWSMCDRDATSDQPISFYKETDQGGLFVLDTEPVETPGSTFGEPQLAMHLLLSVLGQPVNGLGQYVIPYRNEGDFRTAIREMDARFEPFVVHDADVPVTEVTEQIVTIGNDMLSFGEPVTAKPVIIVRSGLSSGDLESIYGTMLWFKQLVRMEPHTCAYADRLASAFRFAWIPCAAPWEAPDGWGRAAQPPPLPTEIDVEEAQMAALIDIVSRPVNRARVIIPTDQGEYGRFIRWVP